MRLPLSDEGGFVLETLYSFSGCVLAFLGGRWGQRAAFPLGCGVALAVRGPARRGHPAAAGYSKIRPLWGHAVERPRHLALRGWGYAAQWHGGANLPATAYKKADT